MFQFSPEFCNVGLYVDINSLNYPLSIHQDFEVAQTYPTHTEDGIPIRKLYVTNLPPQVTRTELFNLFNQFGHIRSCWLHSAGVNMGPTTSGPRPCYAFVTYSNPADAHKAMTANPFIKRLHGKAIKTLPADSWHQPYEDPQGNIIWDLRKRGHRPGAGNSEEPAQTAEQTEQAPEQTVDYTILDILNRDCMLHVMSFVPLKDLLRSERVSKRWRDNVRDYLQGIKFFTTANWDYSNAALTTAVLRQLLARLGPSLLRFHIDHYRTALNDRTAHALGRFCPILEELKVVGMTTINWNPLFRGCKNLTTVTFTNCCGLTDISLIPALDTESSVRHLILENNTQVTGLFLTRNKPLQLESLCFSNCIRLQDKMYLSIFEFAVVGIVEEKGDRNITLGQFLLRSLTDNSSLKVLKLDKVPDSVVEQLPAILRSVPQLHTFSFTDFTIFSSGLYWENHICDVFDNCLKQLKVLELTKNNYINDNILKHIANGCTELVELNLSACNSKKPKWALTDDGLCTLTACKQLRVLNISYLNQVRVRGISAFGKITSLNELYLRGLDCLSDNCIANVVKGCHSLQLLDICGSAGVTSNLPSLVSEQTANRRHTLVLFVAGTDAAEKDSPSSEHLKVERLTDLSERHCHNDTVLEDYLDSEDEADLSDDPDQYEFDDYIDSDDDFHGMDYDEVIEALEWGIQPGVMFM